MKPNIVAHPEARVPNPSLQSAYCGLRLPHATELKG